MAQKVATVNVWDMLDKVNITARVTTYGDTSESAPMTTYTNAVLIQGEGEDDDKEWLRDALVALLEVV